MDATIKAQWLEDLRSGNFRKGTGVLHASTPDPEGGADVHTFCCLGVLCEQAVAAGVVDRDEYQDYGRKIFEYGPGQDRNYLPEEVANWAGLTNCNPSVRVPDGYGNDTGDLLSALNDETFKDFGPIADLIDAFMPEDVSTDA